MKGIRYVALAGAWLAVTAGVFLGCPAPPSDQDGAGGGNAVPGGRGGAAAALGTGGGTQTGGSGNVSGQGGSGGAVGTGGRAIGAAGTGAGGAPGAGGVLGTGGASGTGGLPGTAGARGSGGRAATGGAAGSSVSVPPNCVLPATVGFKADVRSFLATGCGGGNCHVIDASSTVSNGGFDHAYDWITGGAHASSCPGTPTPMRFQVVMAVINGANPSSCSRSRQMPPPNATGADLRTPLTPCQVAALQTWLNEPLVTQMHRVDDSSPTTPYPMPPYN